ncbi:Exocyst complex component 5 [Rhizoctonia solani]
MDPSVENLLGTRTFEDQFDIKEFVSSISENLIQQSNQEPGPFDPRPFIRNFEAAVDKLLTIRKDIQKKTEMLEKSVKSAEEEYNQKMVELNSGLSRGDTSSLETLKKETKSREGTRQVAIILRRLNVVAKEVDVPGADTTRENIERYCEKFEKDMLKLFDRYYRKGDPKMMAVCQTYYLTWFSQLMRVVSDVRKHYLSSTEGHHVSKCPDETNLVWQSLLDPYTAAPKKEPGLSAIFSEIRATVEQEAQIIQAVFPNPPIVMQVFLQRVFAQVIQQYLEAALERASTISNLAFLRMLNMAHIQTSALVEDLKQFDLSTTITRSNPAPAPVDPLAASGSAGAGAAAPFGPMLDTAMEEIFVPHTEGTKYLERESKSLGEMYLNLLLRFTKYHEKASKSKTSNLYGRLVNQLANAAATSSSNSAPGSTRAQAAAAFMKFSGISGTPVESEDDPVKEEDGAPSIEVAETMLKWHAEAIGRCVEIGPTSEVPKHALSLLRVLSEALGRSYIEVAIETAQNRLESRDTKTEPDLSGLAIIRCTDLICHLWQQYINIALLPLASSSVTLRREMSIFSSQTISRIEGATNTLMQKIIDAVLVYLASQLSKQKKNDFKPRNDDLSFARVNTDPCTACCEMLDKFRDVAKENTSGKNLEYLLTEVGTSFHSLLLEHLRKFSVNETGGIMLAKDLKSYQDTISTYNIAALDERYEFLRQLGNVFLVPAQSLKSFVTESYLGRIDAQLLRPYLAQRSDWNQTERGYDGEIPTVDANDASSRGLKERLGVTGKLAAVVRELDNLRVGDEGNNVTFDPDEVSDREVFPRTPTLAGSTSSLNDSLLQSPYIALEGNCRAWWGDRTSMDSSNWRTSLDLRAREHAFRGLASCESLGPLKNSPQSDETVSITPAPTPGRCSVSGAKISPLPHADVGPRSSCGPLAQPIQLVDTSISGLLRPSVPPSPESNASVARQLQLATRTADLLSGEIDGNITFDSPLIPRLSVDQFTDTDPLYLHSIGLSPHLNVSQTNSSMVVHCDQSSLAPPCVSMAQTQSGRSALREAGIAHGSPRALAPSLPVENVSTRSGSSNFFQRFVRKTFSKSSLAVPTMGSQSLSARSSASSQKSQRSALDTTYSFGQPETSNSGSSATPKRSRWALLQRFVAKPSTAAKASGADTTRRPRNQLKQRNIDHTRRHTFLTVNSSAVSFFGDPLARIDPFARSDGLGATVSPIEPDSIVPPSNNAYATESHAAHITGFHDRKCLYKSGNDDIDEIGPDSSIFLTPDMARCGWGVQNSLALPPNPLANAKPVGPGAGLSDRHPIVKRIGRRHSAPMLNAFS